MKKIQLYVFIICCLVICTSSQTVVKEETKFNLKSKNLTEVINRYSIIDKEVHAVYQKDTTRIELYLQQDKDGKTSRVANFDETPESYYASFNLIRNKDDKIIYIVEYPACESGDWDMRYENYFDSDGNLIFFARKCSFFNGKCAEIINEKSEYFYNKEHELIKKTYEITDGDGKSLDYKNCVFYYRFEYKIYETLTEYFKAKKFDTESTPNNL